MVGAAAILAAVALKWTLTTSQQRAQTPNPTRVDYRIPAHVDLREFTKNKDIPKVIDRTFIAAQNIGPGAQSVVIDDHKLLKDVGENSRSIKTREAEFHVAHRVTEEDMTFRIDFLQERKLSSDHESQIKRLIRRNVWSGQVPLTPTSRKPYTMVFHLRVRGLIGLAERIQDGVSKKRFSWGESTPDGALLNTSNLWVSADSPKKLLDAYIVLERNFSYTTIDLFANSAKIKNHRRHPNGRIENLVLEGPVYKKLLMTALPMAAARGDSSTYSNVTSNSAGNNLVRIQMDRYSKLKDYTSPLSLLMERQEAGHWLIIEEVSESRP